MHVREAFNKSTAWYVGGGGGVKPTSSPPWNAQAEAHIADPDNRHAATVLTPIIARMRTERAGLWHMLENAPLNWRTWAAANGPEKRAFDKAVTEVARRVERAYPGLELHVNVKPREVLVRSGNEAAGLVRKINADHSYLRIVARLEEIEADNPQATRAECVKLLSARMRAQEPDKPHGEALIRKAITRVNAIRKRGTQMQRYGEEQ